MLLRKVIVSVLRGICLLLPFSLLYAQPDDARNTQIARFLEEGIFDPAVISEGMLYASLEAMYYQETDLARKSQIAERWLKVKWWRLWETNSEMPAEYVLIGNTLPPYATPSENWQWTDKLPLPTSPQDLSQEYFTRAHADPVGKGTSRHGFQGTLPYILPANGRLLQYVYLPANQQPDTIWLRIETGPLLGTPQSPTRVQVRWTQRAISLLDSENRPASFWAGTIPQEEGWHLLSADLTDLGLGGQHRIIRGIEYLVNGGQVWFGPTMLRRPQVEFRGAHPYHVFAVDEPLQFDLTVHNFSSVPEHYVLNLVATDYAGNRLFNTDYSFDIPAKSHHSESLVLPLDTVRYAVIQYTLHNARETVYQGYSAAARIMPNHSGRYDGSPFGMMYWDQPGQEMVELYEQLGVKLVVIFPELPRLHRFDSQKFSLMPMIWSLPEVDSPEAEKLRQTIQPYLQAGHTIFSNFWETDLRVPATLFAPKMQNFSAIVKAIEPTALVGIGGMAWFNIAYVHQLFQAFSQTSDQAPSVDFLTAMSYTTPSSPEFSGLAREATALKTLLHQHHSSNTELWNVEWAYFENLNVDDNVWLNTGVPRHLIAPYTIRHHLTGFGAGIDRMVPGTLFYTGRTPLAKNYGHSMTLGRSSILRYDLTPLPMLPAYATMTYLLEDKTYAGNLSLHPNIVCQMYQPSESSESPTVLALWSIIEHEQVTLPIVQEDRDTDVTIVSMLGDEREHSTYQGKLHLSVSPELQYVLLPAHHQIQATNPVHLQEDLLFASVPDALQLLPGQSQRIALTYRIANPGQQPLHGILRLREPNWLTILDADVRYSNDMQRQLAALMLNEQPLHDHRGVEFWLGRDHAVDVTYDVEIPAHIPRQTYYEQIALTQQPWFTIATEVHAVMPEESTNGPIIAQATTPVSILPPLEVKLHPFLATAAAVNSPQVQVHITNHSPVVRQGTLTMKAPPRLHIIPGNASFSVPAGETHTYIFDLQGGDGYVREYDLEIVDTRFQRTTSHVFLQPNQKSRLNHYRQKEGYLSSFGVGEGYVIEALVKDEVGYETRQSRGFAFRPAVRATQAIRIDGQLDDWNQANPLFIHPEGRLSGLTFFARDYGGEMQWTGLEDFSAAWQMLWDADNLYLAVKAWDDQILPYKPLGDFWNGDTITFQIDPRPEITDAGPLPATRDLWDIHTFEMALETLESGEYQPVIRRKHPTHQHPAGIVKAIRLAALRVSDGIVYELAIPWQELAPLTPITKNWLGLSMVFYEDDGNGRETRINWFGGSGGNGLAREPRLMGDVHLCR